jgi:phage terminase large subunit GpA-like protein
MSRRSKRRKKTKRSTRQTDIRISIEVKPVVTTDPVHCAALKECLKAFRYEVPMLPSKWQEEYRTLPRGTSAVSGRWHNFPYQAEMLDAIADPECSSVSFMVASQVIGKTSVVEGIIGWQIDQAPCATVAIFPTDSNAKAWSKNRLGPMIDATPVLHGKIYSETESHARMAGRGLNTLVHKRYPGGWFLAGGSNSPRNLRAHTAKLCIFEEVDGYPESSGEEGDVIILTEQRSVTFPDAFSIKSGTPTLKGASRIEKEMELTDWRKWFVKCVKCAHEFVIMWKDVVWDKTIDAKGKTTEHHIETARIICPGCGKAYDEPGRYRLVEKGRWLATRKGHFAHRGFWANAFITMLKPKRGFKSWAHYWAYRFLSAKKLGPTGIRTFQNLILAEGYEAEGEKPPEHEQLYARREMYFETSANDVILPERVLFLVAGADVQQDRIEAEIIGVGLDDEIYGVCYKIFRGNTETPQLFNELDRWMQTLWRHPSGHMLKVECACIDANNKPEQIYAFVNRCSPRRVYAIRGMRGYQPNWISRSQGRNQRLFLLKVDTAKEALYSRLRLIDHGAGFQHFPANPQLGYDLVYFQQLTAEVMRTSFSGGRIVRYFDLASSGAHNEALDCRVYGMAAKELLIPNYPEIIKNLGIAPINDWRVEPVAVPPPPEPTDVLNPGIPLRDVTAPAPRIARQRMRGWCKAW